MNTPRQILFGLVLGVTCAYHLGIGVVSLLSPETTLNIAAMLYDVHASAFAPQIVYLLKALGMYALFTGALLAISLTNPARYRHIVYVCAGLLALRAMTRLVFFDVLNDAFAVEWGRNLINVTLLIVQSGILVGFCPTSAAEEAAAPEPVHVPLRDALVSASRRLATVSAPSTSGIISGIR